MPSVIPTHDATTETAFAWRHGWVMAKRALLKIKDLLVASVLVIPTPAKMGESVWRMLIRTNVSARKGILVKTVKSQQVLQIRVNQIPVKMADSVPQWTINPYVSVQNNMRENSVKNPLVLAQGLALARVQGVSHRVTPIPV